MTKDAGTLEGAARHKPCLRDPGIRLCRQREGFESPLTVF